MNTTGVEAFDTTLQKTNVWLHPVCGSYGLRHKCHIAHMVYEPTGDNRDARLRVLLQQVREAFRMGYFD